MKLLILGGGFLIGLLLCSATAHTEEVVSLPGGNAILNAPTSPIASIILVPGGDRQVNIDVGGPHKQLTSPAVSTRQAYAAFGIASLLIDAYVSMPAAVDYMRRFGKPVILVGMSNGSLKIMEGLGSNPSGMVLLSARLHDVQDKLGHQPGLPILVIANPDDHCDNTNADYVETFKSWGGRRVKVVWVGGGDPSVTDNRYRCQNPAAPHFMGGHEREIVAAIVSFVKSLR
jgi:hypothetical protein